MAGTVRIAILADGRKARQELQSVGKEGSRLGSILKTGLVAGAAAAGAGLAKFALDGIKGAEEYLKLQRKTAAVIKSTGNAARISVKGVKSLAGQIETLSGVDENLIIDAQNVLATFTQVRNGVGKSNKIFDRATLAATNMSEALGTSLKGSTIQLGKALNDPIKGISALSRSGVSFTAQQKEQIKALVASGKTLKAQKLILAEVEKEFGGVAKAAGGTGFTGVVNRVKDAFGDLGRDVMTNALPSLTRIGGWLEKDGIPKFGAFVTFVQTKFIPDVIGAFRGIGQRLPKIDLGKVRDNLLADVRGFSRPLVDAFKVGIETGQWGPLGTALGRALVDAIRGAANLVGQIGSAIGDAAGRVDWLQVGRKVGAQAVPFTVGFLNELFTPLLSAEFWKKNWAAVFTAAIGFVPFGKGASLFGRIGAKLGLDTGFTGSIIRALEGSIGRVGRAVFDFFGWLGRTFFTGFKSAFPGVGAAVGNFVKGIAGRFTLGRTLVKAAVKLNLGGIVSAFGEFVGNGIAAAGRLVARIIGALVGAVRSSGARVAGSGRGVITSLASGMRAGFSRVTGAITNLGSRIKSAAAGFGGLLLDAGVQVMSGLVSGIQQGYDQKVKPLLNWITSRIPFEKGPPAKDKRLLLKAGKLVMGGFQAGLESSYGNVKRSLRRFTLGIASKRDAKIVQDAFGRAIKSITRQVQAQKAVLDKWRQAKADLGSNITSSLRGAGIGDVDLTAAKGARAQQALIVNGFQARLKAVKDFQRGLLALRKRGLSADVVRQIADSGLESGLQYIGALRSAGPGLLRQISSINQQINSSSLSAGQRISQSVFGDKIAAAGKGLPPQQVIVRLESGGSKLDDLLLQVLRRSIRVKGGNVQLVLGS